MRTHLYWSCEGRNSGDKVLDLTDENRAVVECESCQRWYDKFREEHP